MDKTNQPYVFLSIAAPSENLCLKPPIYISKDTDIVFFPAIDWKRFGGLKSRRDIFCVACIHNCFAGLQRRYWDLPARAICNTPNNSKL